MSKPQDGTWGYGMDDPSTVFREKYESLRVTYESRLASLATTVRAAVANTEDDEVFLQLNASSNTKEFARQHAISLITWHLVSERDTSFHALAMKLADAEAEASRSNRRVKELSSSLSVLQGESTTNERSRIKVTEVNAEVQDLRREYQIALEDARAVCRQLKAELADGQRREAVLVEERDDQEAQKRSLHAALVDARARGLEADLKGTGLPRLERELGEERSINAKLSSELVHTKQRLGELAESHQRLKFQGQSLRNDVSQRDRSLQLAYESRKKSEVQFREAITRMETLSEEEAKDNASAIKDLHDKAMLAKGRLSAEIERLRSANAQLTEAMAASKAKSSELEQQVKTSLKNKEASESAAAAREELLRGEIEQARTRADTMSQSLAEAIRGQSGLVMETANAKAAAEILEAKNRAEELERARSAGRETEKARACTNQPPPSAIPGGGWGADFSRSFVAGMEKLLADKLEEASKHISELRTMLHQEVTRREAAEQEVSEAQGYLNSSRQELGELKHLAWKLEQMGRNSVARIDAKNQAIEQLEGQLHVRGGRCPAVAAVAAGETDGRSGDKIREYRDQNCSKKSYQGANTRGDVKKAVRSAAHCSQLLAFSSGESGQQAMLAALSELRSDLQCMNTQLGEAKAENEDMIRRCANGMASRADQLVQALKLANRKQAEAQRRLSEVQAVGTKDRKAAATLACVVKGMSEIFHNTLRVDVPIDLSDRSALGDYPEGTVARRLSELAALVEDAVTTTEARAKQGLFRKAALRHPDKDSLKGGGNHTTALDCMVWGDRSKDDFNMLAQLQKIEVESELQSLQARLDDMTEKYSRAMAERDKAESAPLHDIRERSKAKEEAARASRAHSVAMATVEATLKAERIRCQDMRVRLERQTREHQVALTNAEERLLHNQQELDKVQHALEKAQFALEREIARRARMEKKISELEDRGCASPLSMSPRHWQSEAPRRKTKETDSKRIAQPSLRRTSSARFLLKEARATLGQESDGDWVASRDKQEICGFSGESALDAASVVVRGESARGSRQGGLDL